MYIVTQISLHILIGESRLHGIDGCHQTGVLVHRITVDDDVPDNRTQLLVTTRFQP